MATLTIRNIDDDLKARLRVRAAEHGRSMEEEVRAILRTTLSREPTEEGMGSQIRRLFEDVDADLIEDFISALPDRKSDPERPVELPE